MTLTSFTAAVRAAVPQMTIAPSADTPPPVGMTRVQFHLQEKPLGVDLTIRVGVDGEAHTVSLSDEHEAVAFISSLVTEIDDAGDPTT